MSCSNTLYPSRLKSLVERYRNIVERPNPVDSTWQNGWYERFENPVLTRDHIPLTWRYDLNPETNPRLLERLGVNAVMNSGAIELNGKFYLITRTEGYDRKSFFALAESDNGVDNFRYQELPVDIPEIDPPTTNMYDMRLVKHEDGWIYGTFCVERKSKNAPASDTSAADAQTGIVRTRDLKTWERLPDLKTRSAQQRNVVLHPEFVNGKYAFYTRPQDGFIDTGSGGGIGWGYADSMENAVIGEEIIINGRVYHTIKEVKNGMGAAPIKTPEGWLHIAHGVRGTASGLRYVLFAFLCDLNEPWKVIAEPGGHFLAPLGYERVGDLVSIVFSNGLVLRDNGEVLLYYASCDTRMHVARTNVETLLDYVKGTPPDALTSAACVRQRIDLVKKNLAYIQAHPECALLKQTR